MIANLDVSVISVRHIEGAAGNLKAFVDIQFGPLVITQCAVMEGKRGLFATLPRQLSRDGRWRDVVMCVDDEVKEEIQKAILKGYRADIPSRSGL